MANRAEWHAEFGQMQPGGRVKALCPDGRYRTAQITGHADTWFSIPARVAVRGKTVTGYVTGDEVSTTGHSFRPYLYRKNHALLSVPEKS